MTLVHRAVLLLWVIGSLLLWSTTKVIKVVVVVEDTTTASTKQRQDTTKAALPKEAPRSTGVASTTTMKMVKNNNKNSKSKTMMDCFQKQKGRKKQGRSKLLSISEYWDPNSHCSTNWHDRVLFMHLGKSGGGSFIDMTKKMGMIIGYCHPQPKECWQYFAKGSIETVLLSIRDPVDRFVSAFNWRGMTLCGDPMVDHRQKHQAKASGWPDIYCRPQGVRAGGHDERDVIHNKYQYNVNRLAESLCQDGPVGDLARSHASSIQHSRFHIHDWLQSFLQPPENGEDANLPSVQKIMALVMELRDQSYDQTIRDALSFLMMEEYGPTAMLAAPWANTSAAAVEVPNSLMHSSRSNSYPAGIQATLIISKLGECCLARHYLKDYHLLQIMAEEMQPSEWEQQYGYLDPRITRACHWGHEDDYQRCINSLKHMIARRQEYLAQWEVPCHDLVSQ